MIKVLLSSIRQYKKDSILTPVYVIFESIMEVLIPTLMAYLIDYGIMQEDMSNVFKIGLGLVFCSMISLISGILAGRSAAIASAGFAKNLRHDIYYNVQNFSFSNVDKFSTASLVTRLTTDITNVQNAYMMFIRMAIRSPFIMIFALIMAFRIDAHISLIFLVIMPVLLFGLLFIATYVHPIFVRIFKTYDKLNSVAQENLRGIRVVKSFTREAHEEKKFGRISELIFKDFSKAEKILAFNMPLMQFCVYAAMILISWLSAKAIIASNNNPAIGLSTGDLTGLITYTMQILMSLMMLSMVFVMIIISRASAERIVEVLTEESDLKNCDEPVYEVKNGSVSFENVSFSYARKTDKPVLDGINFSIESGETVGILGGTGASKSSLVQLIPRLYDVVSGRLTVGGVDVRNYDIESLRNQVAMVLQKNVLFSGTIKENLRWGNEHASDEDLIRVCKQAQADSFVQEFPDTYDTYIEQGGANVSGGQKQRLCIARALLKNPKILILDDSTSAVDTTTDSLIRHAFKKEIPDTTKIIIAQRIKSIQDADKIIVLDEGRINAIGTHDELLETCKIYREVYESQNRESLIHE
ncbi:ABC transporter ATP-binding protein [Sediminispirochaeta smaragdinae]|uniref:ABC transporter related protein n=1 Tax=Sediminispirochaeta smaragdinae (strain DSM 11293 / JCM 15392 / SEBR 4228) TaxID=573413 RepID=E1RAJ9_SEDSS|nr:ABC transporter ATP-binding protein [Sediminispirochaeta smaragdinae]ADK82367.1 ABC transporter related protein [Sediminispirochaeta smaragdinae DSM 11293]